MDDVITRIKSGQPATEVARDLGIAPEAVASAVGSWLDERRRATADDVETQRAAQADRLGALVAALHPLAATGDVEAARVLLLAEARLAKLLALDRAPAAESLTRPIRVEFA